MGGDGGLVDQLTCPACCKALRNDVDQVGMVLLCPFCEQAFVMPNSDSAAMPVVLQDRQGAYTRSQRVSGIRPRGIVAISAVGISACGIIFILAVLLALSCMNSVVEPVTEGFREVTEDIIKETVPVVPAPTTTGQKIMSATVLAVFALIFLWVCIGMLRRRKLARWVFIIFCWMTFAAYIGIFIGIFIMPGRPIKWWTIFVFIPAVVYFGLAFLYLRRKDIKGWFVQATPKVNK